TTYTTQDTGAITLAFGVDVSANPSGSFGGDGSELIFRNGANFVTPNSTNDGYHHNMLRFVDGNVGIGTATPGAFKLNVNGNTNITGTLTASGAITSSVLAAGRVTFAGTAGVLTDDADLTFATDTLTATKLLAPTSVSTPSLIS